MVIAGETEGLRSKRDVVDIIHDLLNYILKHGNDPDKVREISIYHRVYRKYLEQFMGRGIVAQAGTNRVKLTKQGRELLSLVSMLRKFIEAPEDLEEHGETIETYSQLEPLKLRTRAMYIGGAFGKARSFYDTIACILSNSLIATAKTRVMNKCSLNIHQFKKYLDILIDKDLVHTYYTDDVMKIHTTPRGLLYLLVYRRILRILYRERCKV